MSDELRTNTPGVVSHKQPLSLHAVLIRRV
jgi:hypothetical protein